MKYEYETTVPDSHPALAGHFPGQAVVPGVVILQLVQLCMQNGLQDAVICALPKVKFLAPLLPEQGIRIVCEGGGTAFQFSCYHHADLVAHGTLQIIHHE